MNAQVKKIEPLRNDLPVYPVDRAAKLIGIHPKTLTHYRREGLVWPEWRDGKPLFSENDIRWAGCLRSMIHQQKYSIPGIKKMLRIMPCWEAADCPASVNCSCNARVDRSMPRALRLYRQGDPAREWPDVGGATERNLRLFSMK